MKRAVALATVMLSACMAQPFTPVYPDAALPPQPDAGNGRFHIDNFRDPSVHGVWAKLNQLDCRGCHGNDLTGGAVPISCDACHRPGWRTTCTFCHGGTLNPTGAPPRDIRGETDLALISYRAHPSHVSEGIHPAFDCSQCHRKPTDVLSPGHLFDETPGTAEVDFSAGLSSRGTYLGNGQCSTLYCHGNGLGDNGSYGHDRPRPACDSCHPHLLSSEAAWDAMSGAHRDHLKEGLVCASCHQIVMSLQHVNGIKDVVLEPATGMSRSAGTCTGTCHGETHQSQIWTD